MNILLKLLKLMGLDVHDELKLLMVIIKELLKLMCSELVEYVIIIVKIDRWWAIK